MTTYPLHTGSKFDAVISKLLHLRLLLATALILLLAIPAGAATLHEQSLTMLQKSIKSANPRDFTFVVLGDNRGNDTTFRKALKLAASFNPLFILHEGDVSESGTLPEIDHFLKTVQSAIPGIPMFVVMGNHEIRPIFEQKVAPLNYSLDLPELDARVVVVDNSDYTLKVKQLEFLRSKLDGTRRLTFTSMHIPPKTPRWNWHTFHDGSRELIELLGEKKVTMAFYGHIHLYDEDIIRGVPQIISGGAGAPLIPFGFPGDPSYHIVVVRVKDGKAAHTKVKLAEQN